MAKTKFSMEEAFLELDKIIKALEEPEIKLAESMDLYKKGVKLLEKCHATLDKTEKEMIILKEGQHASILKESDSGECEKD